MTSSNGNIFRVTLPALCEGNPSVTGGFLSQRAVTRSFDVFFDMRLNKRLSKQWRRRWFGRHRVHYDVTVMVEDKTPHVSGVITTTLRLLLASPVHQQPYYWPPFQWIFQFHDQKVYVDNFMIHECMFLWRIENPVRSCLYTTVWTCYINFPIATPIRPVPGTLLARSLPSFGFLLHKGPPGTTRDVV